ncbi:MAG: primosomal protein N' [Fervidobacterium sp.]
MFYAIALSNSTLSKLLLCESLEDIEIGERVIIKYKEKKMKGYVVSKANNLSDFPENISSLILNETLEDACQISDRLDYRSFLEPSRVEALLKLSKRFGSGIGRYFDISFPPGFDNYFSLFVESVNPLVNIPKMPYEEFKKLKNYRQYILNDIVRVYRDFEVNKPKPRSREIFVRLKVSYDEISKLKFTSDQCIVVNYLLLNDCVRLDTLIEDTKVKRDAIVQLKNREIIELLDHIVETEQRKQTIVLEDEQKQVVNNILSYDMSKPKKHLIFGPTGSGKTEIYMEVIEKYLYFGNVLYLIPEVSLTEQTIARLRKRFPDVPIETYNSYLTTSKRVEVWAKAIKGEISILVGPRSAAFIPLKDLRLVVIDEEHDESYYNNSEPFYDLRDFLEFLPVTVIYGSATPSLGTLKNAKDKVYVYNKLKKRYSSSLPDVEVVDMRKEKKLTPSISEKLYKAIDETLQMKKSVLIFTRRKGFSRVQCAVCGYILKCDNCDVSMTYHIERDKLKCHLCGEEKNLISNCPNCQATLFIDKGTGTEKVEKELRTLFPAKNIGRIDAEVVDNPEKLKKFFDTLRSGELEIVVGTKMITKGLDIYKIGLVGVIDIDALISYPDINAPLRTFQILVQVVGRAGRREKGKAIIQTYNPESPIIFYASNQDAEGFYERELELRKELNYPPFADVIQLMYSNLDSKTARETIETVVDELERIINSEDFYNVNNNYIELLGPSEHIIFKLANKYRYQVFLKTNNVERGLEIVKKVISNYPGDWTIKVNPTEI